MVVTVSLRSVFGAFIWFLIIGVPLYLVGQLIVEWRFTLFLVLLFSLAAGVAVSLSKGFDAYYRRRPGTVQHRLHTTSEAAYQRELAVQAELGVSGGAARLAARKAARTAVEAERQLMLEEQDQAVADREADRRRRADEAAAAAARARATAEDRVARRF